MTPEAAQVPQARHPFWDEPQVRARREKIERGLERIAKLRDRRDESARREYDYEYAQAARGLSDLQNLMCERFRDDQRAWDDVWPEYGMLSHRHIDLTQPYRPVEPGPRHFDPRRSRLPGHADGCVQATTTDWIWL